MSQEYFDSLFYDASKQIHLYAKELRNSMTTAEKILWKQIRNKQIANCKFRHQHPIGIFIADFYCHEKKLVIEVDGEIHNTQKEYDIGRTAEMENYGITVIRFTNSNIETNIKFVIKKINEICEKL